MGRAASLWRERQLCEDPLLLNGGNDLSPAGQWCGAALAGERSRLRFRRYLMPEKWSQLASPLIHLQFRGASSAATTATAFYNTTLLRATAGPTSKAASI